MKTRRIIARSASALRRGSRQGFQWQRNLFFEPLENRNLLSATAFEHDGIGYFLDVTNRELDRYDIANEEWLASTPLAGAASPPTCALVDNDGIYVAYNTSVYRYQLDGTTPVHLLNATSTVQALHTDGNVLFVNHTSGLYARFVSINKATNTIIATFENYVESVVGSSIAPQANRIFGRTAGVSPSDITYVAYNDDGTFAGGGDSPYHGDYPGGPPTWTFPDGGKVVDSSGTVYSTNSLTRLNSFGTHIDEIDFAGGTVPIVRNGTVLTAYTVGLLPTGSYDLGDVPRELLVSNEKIFVVYDDGAAASGYRVDVVPLAALNAPEPGAPIDPNGLTYTPDQVMRASDGNILVFSKAHQSVFRWDPVRQEFGTTIPLIGAPDYMTYSSETNTIYLAYATGLIRKIDLNLDNPEEVPFATLATSPLGLAAAGKYLFAADSSGAWMSHYTFAPDGTQLSVKDWNYYSTEYIWSDVQQKMYFFRDDTSPNDLLSEVITEGILSGYTDSPLHDSYGFSHPIRVSPDGSTVVLGSGKIHDATTLARKTQALSESVSDIAWLGNRMFTVRNIAGVSQVKEWLGSTYAPGNVQQFSGTAHSLTAIGTDRLLLISLNAETPVFTLLDANLNVIAKPTPVANAGADQRVPIGVPIQLDGSASFDPDNSPNPLIFTWSIVSGPGEGVFGDSSQAVTNFTGQSAGDYVLRLTVSDGTYTSFDTMNVNVRTNIAPVADVSLSETHAVAKRIAAMLDGSRSFDNDGDLLQYEWTILSKPTDSNPSIANSQQQTTSFTADIPGVYTVELTVSDGYLIHKDSVTITVTPNLAPTADASLSGQTGVAGRTSVALDASLSSDPDADALTYTWTVVSGPAEAITNIIGGSQKYASFSANVPGDYTVQVTVSDGELIDTEQVLITLRENQAPTADASASTTFVLAGGNYPSLDGRRSSDPDGDALSYQWSFISSTNGTKPTISMSSASLATLNTNTAGVYAVALVVSDGLKSNTDYVLITLRGNQPPTADASLTNTVGFTGLPVSLNGSLSQDADGDPLTYQWEILTTTNESPLPVITSPQNVISNFVATSAGTYLIRLTVSDGVAQATDFRLITIQAKSNPPLLGDFDQDGDIDGRDFLCWQRGVGTVDADISDGDCNGDANVDGADLAVWQQSYAKPPQFNGDFDRDGDIDGRDFLEWQRGYSPTLTEPNDLTAWQTSFANQPESELPAMLVAEVKVDDTETTDAPQASSLLGVVKVAFLEQSKNTDEPVERLILQNVIVDNVFELLDEPLVWHATAAGDIAVNRERAGYSELPTELEELILAALSD